MKGFEDYSTCALRLVDEAWSSPKSYPDIVYHYTDAAGLNGILRSQKLWATEFRFMNDESEIQLGMRRAIAEIDRQLDGSKDELKKAFLLTLKDHCETDSAYTSYVVSLTSRKDDLSQWRGYASDGYGFSIGFDCAAIKDRLPSRQFSFGEIGYNARAHDRLVKEAIQEFWENFSEGFENERLLLESCEELESVISSYCARYKHSSFKMEDEWRIHLYPTIKSIKVRTSGKRLVPFCEVSLGDRLPIKQIGIGPSFRSQENMYAVERLLQEVGVEAEIYFANTPFRGMP